MKIRLLKQKLSKLGKRTVGKKGGKVDGINKVDNNDKVEEADTTTWTPPTAEEWAAWFAAGVIEPVEFQAFTTLM